MSPMTTAQLELKRKPSRRRVSDIPPNLRMAAYLLEQLLRHDRQARVIRPPRDRREWGIARLTDYLRAIGAEIAGGGEAALWEALRVTVALQPTRREEGLIRLIRLWAPFGDWLGDQNITAPPLPRGYELPAAPRTYQTVYDDPRAPAA
jgi:hypothetical protein